MRKILFLLLLSLPFVSFAQLQNPVKWSFSSKKIDATTFEISLMATLDPAWHIYSQSTPDGGPAATAIAFAKNPLIALDGAVKEIGKLEQRHEVLFGVDVKQFSNKVVFVQTLKLKAKAKTAVNGTIDYMTCNNQQCLPPRTQKFSITLQ